MKIENIQNDNKNKMINNNIKILKILFNNKSQ